MVERLMNASAALVRILSEDVKLAPADLQWLISVDEEVVASNSYQPPLQFIGLLVTQKIFALDGAEMAAMLRSVKGTETDPQEVTFMIDTFLRGLEYGQGWNGDLTKAAALRWLDTEGASTLSRAEERELRRTAFRNGRTYLASR
jgi:hypothetical protein